MPRGRRVSPGSWQIPGIGREENQQLRDGSLLPARTLQAGIRRREEARLGLLALKRLDQFQLRSPPRSCTIPLDGVAFLPGTDAPRRPVDRYESMMDV